MADNDGMTFHQKAVGFLWQAGLFVLCFAVAMIGCIALGSEIVELFYRHEMGFSLHERLGRDLWLGIYEVMGLIPEVVIGLAVGTWLTTFIMKTPPQQAAGYLKEYGLRRRALPLEQPQLRLGWL